MRTPYDEYAKGLALAWLRADGRAESDTRFTAEAQYADLTFVLPPGHALPPPRDLLTELLAPAVLFEFSHDPPDLATTQSWQHKRDQWWMRQRREAREQKRPPPKHPPRLVALCAGDPVEARTDSWMRPHADLVGCYEGPPASTFLLVVISALPRTRYTLLVRTMGAGDTLRKALAELAALPIDAPERTATAPLIVTLQMALQKDPSPVAKDSLMDAQKIYHEMMAEQLRLGIVQGIAPLRRQCARRLGRPLSAAEESTLHTRLVQVGPERLGDVVLDLSPEALAAWIADPDAR